MIHGGAQLIAIQIAHDSKVRVQVMLRDLCASAFDCIEYGLNIFVTTFHVVLDLTVPFKVVVTKSQAAFMIRHIYFDFWSLGSFDSSLQLLYRNRRGRIHRVRNHQHLQFQHRWRTMFLSRRLHFPVLDLLQLEA